MDRPANRRRRRGFNIFDLFVLIGVVAVGALAYFVLGGRGDSDEGTLIQVTYKVEIENVSAQVRDSVQIGAAARDGVRKTPLGTVTAMRYTNTSYMKGNVDTGEVVKSEVQDRYNVELTCQADGVLRDGRVQIGDYTMAVGTVISLQSSGISGTGYCISLIYEEAA